MDLKKKKVVVTANSTLYSFDSDAESKPLLSLFLTGGQHRGQAFPPTEAVVDFEQFNSMAISERSSSALLCACQDTNALHHSFLVQKH